MKTKHWLVFIILGLIWSSSFLWIKTEVHEIGPTRTSLVTYLFLLGGVVLGVIFLNEHLSWQLIAGTTLIIASLVVVNWKRKIA